MLYDTIEYAEHYKMLVDRYDQTNHVVDIEERVRPLCKLLRESGLGVSVYSCGGHYEGFIYPQFGYVMVACKDKESSNRFKDLLLECIDALVPESRVLNSFTITSGFGAWGKYPDRKHYPKITIRATSVLKTEDEADLLWSRLHELLLTKGI